MRFVVGGEPLNWGEVAEVSLDSSAVTLDFGTGAEAIARLSEFRVELDAAYVEAVCAARKEGAAE